jgi:predicted transposase YdaD
MHEYDATLKKILTRLDRNALAELTGFAVEKWHNTELPAVRHRRADLLGETASGLLVHIELQISNKADMAQRMLEYALAIHRKFGRFPEQMVLYVGNDPLRMKRAFAGPGLSFKCRMVDIRKIDSEPLLSSTSMAQNVIAVLTRLGNERASVRRILGRIAAGNPDERGTGVAELFALAGLRKLDELIEKEIQRMPILDDIMDSAVIGRERKRGMALGREEGLVEGREKGLAEGRLEGERRAILRLIGKRFGRVSKTAKARLDGMSAAELEKVERRLLDAGSIQELLG